MTLGPITNTFRELNDLLLNQQQWRAQMDARKQEFGLQSRMMEQDIEDRLMKRKFDEYKLREIEDFHAPKPFGMMGLVAKNPITEKHIYNNSEAMADIAKVLDPTGQKGLTYSPADDTWRESSGAVFRISDKNIAELAPALTGIIDARTDTMKMHMDAVDYWQREYDKEAKKLDRIPGGHKGVKTDRGKIMAKPIKERLLEIQQKIEHNAAQLEPMKQLQYYRDKKLQMTQRIAWANARNDDKLAAYFATAMQDNADMEKVIMQQLLADRKGGKKEQIFQRFAVQMDKETGELIPGAIVSLNVSEDLQGAVLPSHIDSRLRSEDGWMFIEGYHALNKGKGDGAGSATNRAVQASKLLSEKYLGKWNEQNMFFPDAAVTNQWKWAQQELGDLLEQDKETNVVKLADKANKTIMAEKHKFLAALEEVAKRKDLSSEDQYNLLQSIKARFQEGSGLTDEDLLNDIDNILQESEVLKLLLTGK